MRHLITILLVLALVSSASAADLGNTRDNTKTNTQVGQNPGTPDSREGGEDMATAFPITAIPFTDTGNTVDNIDDYDASCPYTGSISPDVVYSFTPNTDVNITVDLCGSGYDTKTYVMDADYNIYACNDDNYFDPECGMYVSFILNVPLTAGTEYFFVVDGYGGDAGDYILNLSYYMADPPCDLTCNGVLEGEPTLGPGYFDIFNSGCSGEGYPFQDLSTDSNGELVFCCKSGWYDYEGSEFRDTDWFITIIGEEGVIEWTLDAEQETYGFLLGPHDCYEVEPIQTMTAGPCAPATMVIEGSEGDIVWLWVGPTLFSAPAGFVENEYDYVSYFTGLHSGVVATEPISFDSIKSLYR